MNRSRKRSLGSPCRPLLFALICLFLLPIPGIAAGAGSSASPQIPGAGRPAAVAAPQAQAVETPPPAVEVPGEPEQLEARVLFASPPGPCSTSPELDPQLFPDLQDSSRCQRVQLLITGGSLSGSEVTVEDGRVPFGNKTGVVYQRGDDVLVDLFAGPDGSRQFVITDFKRQAPLLILGVIFLVISLITARLRGLSSVAGLSMSLAVLLFFILPRILAGDDPVFISIAGALLIMIITLYLSHGVSYKTTAAVAGTGFSLLITGLLALVFVGVSKLSGYSSDEAVYLQLVAGDTVNVRGLLLSGMIIGTLGVLDDITISQSAAVFELHNLDPRLSWRELYRRALNIGRDHIAATVNTLVLAYAGASLPLLVLFSMGEEPWLSVINREVVAEEVVRTLVGSIGLVAAVPVATMLAALLAVRRPADPHRLEPHAHPHHHH